MNVLHVIPSLDPASGGPPVVAASLAAAQAAAGCGVGIAAYSFPAAAADVETALRGIPGVAAVTVTYLARLTRAEHLFAREAARQAAPLVARADVVHLHGVWDPLIPAVAAVSARLGRPYVLTPHGMLDPWALSQKRWKKRVALLLGYRRMLARAAFLHFLNADEHALASPLGLAAPARVLPNGIFWQEVDPLPDPGAFRAAHPAVGPHPFVLFLGRLHYKKGLDFLADAFAIASRSMSTLRLVVAGPDGGARREFEDRVARSGAGDRVHLVGPLYGRQKYEAMVDCDCFCLPSRQEGFSLAVTEAMACRAPVVISDACHFPEARDAGAGIVTALDPRHVAAALTTVLTDPARARQMGDAGRRLVRERFTWPGVARDMIAAYAALERPRGRD